MCTCSPKINVSLVVKDSTSWFDVKYRNYCTLTMIHSLGHYSYDLCNNGYWWYSSYVHLMKGLVMARMVLINHDGWRIMKDFKFFLSLRKTSHVKYHIRAHLLHSHSFHSSATNSCQTVLSISMNQRIATFHVTLWYRPPVNHLITFLQPTKTRHSPVRRGSIQIQDHVVLRHHQLQCADHIAVYTHILKPQ